MSSGIGGMAPGGSPVRVDRVVAVVAPLRDGREQVGSGYLVTGRLVLTAAHCTRNKATGEPAGRLWVIRASDGAVADVAEVVRDRDLDVAVLRLADDTPWSTDLQRPVFARVDQSHSGMLDDCTGIGFPLFQRNPDRGTRHTAEFHGAVYQTDERESGRLLMRETRIRPGPVTGPDGDDAGGHGPSPWRGLSGALMFYRGSAIGVVVEHHPRQGDNALLAMGFERIAASAGIRQCLGLPWPDSLPCVSEHVTVQAAPMGGVPVSEADMRRLGVHAAISVPGVPEEIPPEYVPRDVDAAEAGVRAKVATAAERGGFVLLVGGSSVGKTRCAAEAVKALLPDWWLVHPDGPAEIAALAQSPSPRTVVWLDELQRYLDVEQGLTGGTMRALLSAPHPVVIIGTLWPERYAAYTALPSPGDADPHGQEREVLDLAAVVRIGPEFSPAEQDRARAAAARDRRLAIALSTAGYGLTQTLAAAPQLVARWQDAQTVSPYAWAVLTAALDAARLGARAPLSVGFLRVAAPSYLTGQQQAEAPGNWFEQALAYATVKLHGAAAALSPAGTGMGRVDGYTVADYLVQHANLERRYSRVPASTWDAIVGHIRDPADTDRLAASARNRLLYRYAVPLYRHTADVLGDATTARYNLAKLLAKRGDLDELRARADAGDWPAARELVDLLAGRGDLDELRARADAGDWYAARKLVDLLAARGDLEGAERIMRARADVDGSYADGQLAERLAGLLAERGDLDEAERILRAWIDAGDDGVALQLVDLLAKRGDLDELRARADADDEYAAEMLAWLLAERGDLEGLRAVGDWYADAQLASLLAERGDLDEAEQILRDWAGAGDGPAARQLASLLAERGDLDEAEQILQARADAGDGPAARQLADMLTERRDLKGLRARADAGDQYFAGRLADLLAECGDLDGLHTRASNGDEAAARRLAEVLTKQGRGEEAERLRKFGLNADGSIAHA